MATSEKQAERQDTTTSRGWIARLLLNPWTVTIVLLAIVGGTLFYMQEEEAEEAPREERTYPVEIEEVTGVTLADTVRGVGTLRASESVVISPEVAGRIRAIHFEEGGAVEEGDLLFELDDDRLRRQRTVREAGLRSIEVRLANAERELERARRLHREGVIPEDQLDRAQTEYDAAVAEQERLEAELSLIERDLADTRIKAPFDGQISERRVDRGAYVRVGDSLATIYRTDPVEIGFSVPERHLGRVRREQSVELMVAAYPEQSFEGIVHFISPSVDEATRTFRVRARVPNPEGDLKPGSFGTVVLTVGVREDRPMVSAESLVATRTGYIVYVVEDGRAHRREVRTGMRRDGMAEILEGAEIGEMVVRTGHIRLSGGEQVSIVEEETPSLPDVLEEGPEPPPGTLEAGDSNAVTPGGAR